MGTSNLAPGALVSDRLRLVRLLGEGGMGTVWLADHLTLRCQVAVKFISQNLAAQHPDLVERFQREATAASKIASPHVARTFDFGAMDDGTQYLVIELLEGESLADRLQRERVLEPATVATIVNQMASALDEAHRMGIVHRDIKPGNIFLGRSGRDLFVKVLDFGIARDVEAGSGSMTKTGVMLGTPQYMSPEQLTSAKGADAQADYWALAVTAYEALTGAPPFSGETMPALIISIHSQDFAPPSSRAGAGAMALRELDKFFTRAFAKDRAHRFASAHELADAFAAASGGAADRLSVPRTVYGEPFERPSRGTEIAGAATGAAVSRPVAVSKRRKVTSSWPYAALGVVAAGGVAWLATRGAAEPASAPPAPHAEASEATAKSSTVLATPTVPPAGSTANQPATPPFTVSVPEGASEGANAWLPAFTVKSLGVASPSFTDAFVKCRAAGSYACTEAQWAAACGRDASIGSISAWTATIASGSSVVRGGTSCNDRETPAPGAGPYAAVCCDRSIAVVGKHDGFLRATSRKLMEYEAAINSRRADDVTALYEDKVFFLVKDRSKGELHKLVAGHFQANPDGAQLYGRCEVAVVPNVDQWRAVCSTLLFAGGKASGLEQTLVFGGVSGKLARVGESSFQHAQ